MQYILILGSGGNPNIYNLGMMQRARKDLTTNIITISFANVADNVTVGDPTGKYWAFILKALGSGVFDAGTV